MNNRTYFPNALIVALLVLSVRRVFVVKRVHFGLVFVAELIYLQITRKLIN